MSANIDEVSVLPKTRVLLIDDHAVLRAGLRLLLQAQLDMELVGEAADTVEVVELCRATRADVVVLDLAMPNGGGMQTLRQLREQLPDVNIVILTMYESRGYLRAALQAGARGYVTKRSADGDLLAAIRSVRRGELYVDMALMEQARSDRLVESTATHAKLLSVREHEVLTYVARGYTNREIADSLGVSVKTVEAYRARLLEKLGLKTRAELVGYAIASGILQ